MSDTEKELRARAKLNAAMDSMKDALKLASDAAHEMPFEDEEDAQFSRILALGELIDNAGLLCPHDMNILNEIACRLIAMHEGEQEAVEEFREHLH